LFPHEKSILKPIKMLVATTLAIFSFMATGTCAQSEMEKNQAGIQQADADRHWIPACAG